MDGKLKAQEPNTNLMATLWQPYDWARKNLALRRYKTDFEYSDIHLAETKNNAYLCNGLSLTFSRLFRLSANTSGLLQDIKLSNVCPCTFFPKDWIVGTDFSLMCISAKAACL